MPLSRSFKRTAKNVDLSRFEGIWYETARLPFGMEQRDNFDVTAEYTLAGNEIIVKNTEKVRFPNGGIKTVSITGRAMPRGPQEYIKKKYINSQLKVVFDFDGAKPGEFNILFVGGSDAPQPYQYAVIGTRKYLWVLSKKKVVSDFALEKIKDYIQKKYNYDLSKLRRTPFSN